MEIQVNDLLTVETEVPLLEIHRFHFVWKFNQHGIMKLEGILNPNAPGLGEELFDSTIKIKNGEKNQTIFAGCLTDMQAVAFGNVKKVFLEITTGSWKLDGRKRSQSFQRVENTYEDIVRESIEAGGGRVICTAGRETTIEKPIIRYQETEWEFAKRLASCLGAYIIADVETGAPNLWFGIRKGEEIPAFSEEEYQVHIRKEEKASEKQAAYEVQSREYYQLGDTTSFWGESVIISEVRGAYEHGELMFTYRLSRQTASQKIYREPFTVIELLGTVQEVKGEQVKIAFDIDGGISTGDYFYEWLPETGNGVYAMPEKGAKLFVTFADTEERGGFASRCLPTEAGREAIYQNRQLVTREGNTMTLHREQVSLFSEQKHRFVLMNSAVNLQTPKKLKIQSGDKIRLKGKEIIVKTPDIIKMVQG